MLTDHFLLELGTEELPPKLLKQLSLDLSNNLVAELDKLNLAYSKFESFATPRRLAVLVYDLQTQQDEQLIERKGPAVDAPNQAIDGFAKSCGVSRADLAQKTIGKADYYFFSKQQAGLKALDLLENAASLAIKKIPISCPMRWSDLDFNFIRPVHGLVMLLGTKVVNANIMGLISGNITKGLRFTGEPQFAISNAADYQKTLLQKAQIEVDFERRKEIIRQQVMQVATQCQANAVIDETLLDEVCALVEYPRAFSGEFAARFLSVPEEALISAMKTHQKYFHLVDDDGILLPAFISVANIESSDLSLIIDGNQRVIRARLTDSEFFWTQDKAITLAARLQKLDSVLFMRRLGSMGDKVKRIQILAAYVAQQIAANVEHSKRAALLCKSDLLSNMVGEFADLQGIMGGYYAQNDGEPEAVCLAISEHYHPRFSGDTLPSTPEGMALSIADKVDSIVGIYGIGHKPTGSKDPYALKRAGLGLLRMMIESKLKATLWGFIAKSADLYQFDEQIALEIYDFIIKRLPSYYQQEGIQKNIIKAVFAAADNQITSPTNSVYDWHLRIMALNVFMQNDDAKDLVELNKRIKNILKDENPQGADTDFTTPYDKSLFDSLQAVDKIVKNSKDYTLILKEFLKLKPVIDDFFNNVMVNDENSIIKNQRLKLISEIRRIFLTVADFTYLSK